MLAKYKHFNQSNQSKAILCVWKRHIWKLFSHINKKMDMDEPDCMYIDIAKSEECIKNISFFRSKHMSHIQKKDCVWTIVFPIYLLATICKNNWNFTLITVDDLIIFYLKVCAGIEMTDKSSSECFCGNFECLYYWHEKTFAFVD